MLAVILGLAVGTAGLCVAWLVPRHTGPTFATFPLDQLEVGRPQFFRPFNMGYDGQGYGLGMWLVKSPDGEVRTFFSRDTHSGSQTQIATWEGRDGFRALGTGSFYAFDGSRLFGPAPRTLDEFDTRIADAFVEIDMTELILGICAVQGFERCSTATGPRSEEINWPGGE